MYVTFILPGEGFNLPALVSRMIEYLPGSRPWRDGKEIWVPRATGKEQVATALQSAARALKLKGRKPSFQLVGELPGV